MSRTRSTLFAFLGAVAAFSVTACSAAPREEEQASSEQHLNERDWAQAVGYLQKISYLPWGYTNDGCYARALYYTMNLAAEGIPSNHVYIVAKPGFGLGASGAWGYHVAPLVSQDSTGQLLVLDPIYAKTPIPLRNWYERQSQWEGTENAPDLYVASGTTYGQPGTGSRVPDPINADTATFREPASFAEMGAFSIESINGACEKMHEYIDKEGSGSAATKHHDLSRDTKRLVTALADMGKLSGSASQLDAQCTRFAPELASCPADTRETDPGGLQCCLASAFWCYANGACIAPGTVVDGKTCGAGGMFSRTEAAPTNPGAGACPADSPTTNPGSQACCLASRHWCWSHSGQFCAEPGHERVVDGQTWRCSAGGEWTQ
jgi:hypothetical protein